MTDTAPVAIVGAGPVGLALAIGLARHGVRSVVVEKEDSTSRYSKAPVLHVHTREILARWDAARAIEAEGILHPSITLSPSDGGRDLVTIDFSDLEEEAESPGLLVLPQARIEELLLEVVRASGMVDVRFATEAVGLGQDRAGAHLTIRSNGQEESIAARYVVGCDGAASFVRDALDLPFEGFTYSLRPMLADIRIDEDDDQAWARVDISGKGYAFAVRIEPGLWRLVDLEAAAPRDLDSVPDEEVEVQSVRLLGRRPDGIPWASRFRLHLRAAPRFRVGNVLLAGDAAHVHSPVGGLGMNAGIGDAGNLAWKLAGALDGGHAERLLDSYDTERRAVVVGTVSRFTDILTRLFLQMGPVVRRTAFALVRAGLGWPVLRRRALRRASLLDLSYPESQLLDPSNDPVGRRLPNPVMESRDGTMGRLHQLLPTGPAVVDLAGDGSFVDDLPVAPVIRVGPGGHRDLQGILAGFSGGGDCLLLIRPDGYVGWKGSSRQELEDRWVRALGETG